MTKNKFKPNYFLLLFVLIVIMDLVAGSLESAIFRHFTKPLILLSLFLYFAYNGKHLVKSLYLLMLAALFFSWLGDVMLMYDYISDSYFILGLVSFLSAHILYTIVFFKKWKGENSSAFLFVIVLLVAYGGLLFVKMKDGLGELKIPVIVYITAILLMALTAFKRKGGVNNKSFKLVFYGALFFIASDSLLAINKFLTDVPYSHLLVMGTYATAQYMITKGILFQSSETN